MITWEEYQELAGDLLDRNIGREDNPAQHEAIKAPASESQFLVAGPGSGKTTVMVLKILKYIFVDDIVPEAIMATTFTRKAAAQLNSRIINWGNKIKDSLLEQATYEKQHPHLQGLELDRIITGTLDSLAQELLGGILVLEEQATRSILMQKLIQADLQRHPDLLNYLKVLGNQQGTLNLTGMCDLLLEFKDRIYHDQVDLAAFQEGSEHPGARLALNCLKEYQEDLKNRQLYDFARLEAAFLGKLHRGDIPLEGLKVVLVDEYQDTNLLQESIYFQLAREAVKNGGNITVVGDDDQSLYRFRGATVDLFTQYQRRIKGALDVDARVIHLSQNYRSTPQIVNFCNTFLEVDEDYQYARVTSKPSIQATRRGNHYPVLGMFRRDRKTLARDLARFISQALYGEGYHCPEFTIKLDKKDSSLLMASPLEYTTHSARRFPHYLRHFLEEEGLEVYNPRGESLERAHSTELLAGLVLECLDPDRSVENSLDRLPSKARSSFHQWRKTARKSSILEKVQEEWPGNQELHLLELWYDLLSYTHNEDGEECLRAEALTRTIEQASHFAHYQGRVVLGEEASIQEVYWNLLVPLATGAIEVDEMLLNQRPAPPNRVNIMSIHQAKGLEFPLVVVDVGSDYSRIHRSHAYKRFPLDGDRASHLEDQLRAYSPLGEPARTSRDRAFDDLIRQYYVAFSRPQDLLLLIGLLPVKDGYRVDKERFYIPNVATGWDREARWPWRGLDNLFLI
ncbi:DNA helicase UvrD [Methanobacterium sp. CWC-01]|uniref:DEAD/DEAH box helicase n=1 Tax=Methanobacterium aridiramus TaxID=2584467 RepID=UPI002578F3DD|nr:DEAD/DEAH box helicase [Methanobacterium sp. CWC-01]WJI10507.1 DNA helicase UvrD [Methanobacterium sp. CWC-01]